jgi:hypothetical protein
MMSMEFVPLPRLPSYMSKVSGPRTDLSLPINVAFRCTREKGTCMWWDHRPLATSSIGRHGRTATFFREQQQEIALIAVLSLPITVMLHRHAATVSARPYITVIYAAASGREWTADI